MYSNWLLYRPDRLLFDCGEGVATTLGNSAFAIERVLLTHGHIDHIAGLPSLLWARAGGLGDKEKPLRIYFPAGDIFLPDLREYIERVRNKLPFQLEWIGLKAGESFELKHGRRVECFATSHVNGSATLGYKVIETRKKLKGEYAGLSQSEIRVLAQSGGNANLMEATSGIKLAHGGDGWPLEPSVVKGSEILVHEATLVDATERKGKNHSTVDEALEVALAAQPGALLLNHISGRYKRSEIETAIREGAIKRGIQFPIWCLRQDQLWPVWNFPFEGSPSQGSPFQDFLPPAAEPI